MTCVSAMPWGRRPCRWRASSPPHQPRGRHRRRREPRPCYGELLHLDGSRHRWLALTPDRWSTLLAGVDDATQQLLSAELHDGGESVAALMTALRTVLERDGLPLALYTDRAHWAVHPPTSGSAPERRHPPPGRPRPRPARHRA